MVVTRRWQFFNGTKRRPVPVDPQNPTPDEDEAMESGL